MRFLNFKLQIFCLITFLVLGISSCRKPIVIKDVVIAGPTTVCYGDTGVIFSVAPNPDPQGNTYILWTVPEHAQITSGHGTNIIKVDFGRIAGKVGVKYFSDGEEISEESFLDVKFDVQNKWCRELNFGGGKRVGGVGFSIGNKGYVGTGIDYGNSTAHSDFWEFDPLFKTWTQKTDFGGAARGFAVGFSIQGKGYIGTGFTGATNITLKDFWEYNPGTNNWSQKADCSDTARRFAFGFSIGGKGYIGTGQSNIQGSVGLLSDFWEYNPDTDIWVKKANLSPRHSGVGFSIEGKGYFGLGQTNSITFKDDFYEFDPSDTSNGLDTNGNPRGKWTQKNSFPKLARSGAVAFSIGNKGYVGTGKTVGGLKDFYEYNPSPIQGTWDTLLPVFSGEIRHSAIGFSIGNKGYIGAGLNDNNSPNQSFSDFWVFTQ